ncbi:hypothetical protein LDENG_00152620 [Lucifuga dentata]|nr:hypothetical protein LDENG_00152620 [Lucifuga dentata]
MNLHLRAGKSVQPEHTEHPEFVDKTFVLPHSQKRRDINTHPLRCYAYDRVSLCKASTGENRTLTAGRPPAPLRAPKAGRRATQAGQQARETPLLINFPLEEKEERINGSQPRIERSAEEESGFQEPPVPFVILPSLPLLSQAFNSPESFSSISLLPLLF